MAREAVHRPMRLAVAAGLGAAIIAGVSACTKTAATGSQQTFRVQTYTCCVAGDIEPIRHPGQSVSVHWIAEPSQSPGPVAQVTLKVFLDGPFPSVTALKSAMVSVPDAQTSAHLATSSMVVSNQVGNAPVSELTIPKSARPGYYNWTTTVASGGMSASGSTIIQIGAP